MYSHRIVGADGFLIPDLFVDFIDGENLAGVFGQKKQDVVFNRSQLDGFVIYKYFLGVVIDGEAAAFVYIFVAALAHVAKLGVAAQLGFDPGHQLQWVKWLGKVIIRANV